MSNSSYFESSVYDCGAVTDGSLLKGVFKLNSIGKGVGISNVNVGCTCGGRPKISANWGNEGISFSVKAKRLRGDSNIRMMTVSFKNGIRQVISIKYRIR